MKFVITREDDTSQIECVENGVTLGYLTYKFNSKTVWLNKIKVEKNYRNRGIGKALIRIFENDSLDHLKRVVEGKYFPEDEENIVVKTFYESNGYSVSKEGYETEIFKYIRQKHDLSSLKIEYNNIRSR